MKKQLLNLAKIILPLALGVGLIVYFLQSFSEEELVDIYRAFLEADYRWILFSLVFAVLSHISRAYRWKFTLKPLGYKPKLANSFFAVMIAYLVNLAIPRLGEFTRCGVMAKYEKIPYDNLLGTVIAERIADLIIMIAFSFLVLYFQFDVIGSYLGEKLASFNLPLSLTTLLIIAFSFMILVMGGIYLLFTRLQDNAIISKIKGFLLGITEGVKSIWKMEDKVAFILHTIFIWAMYVLMFYICFFSLPETSTVPFEGILTAFIMGGFTVILTNGGIGAYPAMVGIVLGLYGVEGSTAYAFGTIVWAAQTILLLVFGAASFALMPWYNKKRVKYAAELA